jgi:transcription elongation factor Elf1
MTPALTEALMWAGITPPPAGSKKTTCPVCSHTRKKQKERCLTVWESEGLVFVKCHNCGHDDAIV